MLYAVNEPGKYLYYIKQSILNCLLTVEFYQSCATLLEAMEVWLRNFKLFSFIYFKNNFLMIKFQFPIGNIKAGPAGLCLLSVYTNIHITTI